MPVLLFTPGPTRWKLSFAVRSRIVIFVLPAVAECGKAIFSPGPTRPLSAWGAAGGGGGVGVPTVNEPFIVVGCASQTNVYVPTLSVTSQSDVPVPSTVRPRLPPGPARWQLRMAAWSFL